MAAATLVIVVSTPRAARADLVTLFNFNTGTTTSGQPANTATLTSTAGQASTITTNFPATTTGAVVFAGSTVNAVNGDAAGLSLALLGGTGASATGGGNNGDVIEFSIAGTNLSGLAVNYATQATGTGFKTEALSYSTDGVTFTPFGSVTSIPTAFAFENFDLSAVTAINNQATVYFELTFTGATSSSGNARIDNLQVYTVPEPATWFAGLLTVAALGWSQRRRLQELFV